MSENPVQSKQPSVPEPPKLMQIVKDDIRRYFAPAIWLWRKVKGKRKDKLYG